MAKPPKVDIEKLNLIDSHYVDADGYKWSATKLIEASKKYTPFDLPLAGINLWHSPFRCDNLDYFIFQMKRTLETDLQYPIILDNKGQIADSWHRVAKAIIKGRTTIKAIRLEEMPPVDSKEED